MPGDIVYLSPGGIVPADLRLISVKVIFVNQSALAGESMLVKKYVHVIRLGKILFMQSMPSKPLLDTTLAISAFGAYLSYSGFASKLKMVPLPDDCWLYHSGILLVYLGLTQFIKTYLIRHNGFD